MKKVRTLCTVVQQERVLLGLKKRGFGEGRWNGFGGKVEAGESIRAAAWRELWEEARINPVVMEQRGVLTFTFAASADQLEVHVFRVDDFSGEPQETEEMRPQWFPRSQLPYQEMWVDDVHWLPLLLAGKCFNGHFHFANEEQLAQYEVCEISPIDLLVVQR